MSIVGAELAKRLAMAHDVTIFGINYSGQQIDWNGCRLVQNGFLGDANGSQMLPYWVANINPDVYITNLNWQSISWIHSVLNQRYINGRPLGVFLYVPIETEHYPPFIEEKLVKNHLNDVFLIPFNKPQYEMLKRLDAVVDYIPHGYDRNSYYPRPQVRQQVRRWLGVGDRFTIMSVGENWRRKNWHVLVQAFKKLQEMVDNPALIMHTSPAPSRGDSVPSYMPTIVQYQGDYDVISLEQLWRIVEGPVTRTEQGEEIKEVTGVKTIGVGREAEHSVSVKRIIRHYYKGKLLRFITSAGLVDVTPSHSMVTGNGRAVRATELNAGDTILWRKDSEKVPVHGSDYMGGGGTEFFQGTRELAWLYGFFAGDGGISTTRKGNETWPFVTFSNSDEQILERVERILKENFHVPVHKMGKKSEKSISKYCHNKKLYEHFKNRCYTGNPYTAHSKKVPKEILNAPLEIKKEYLKGLMDSDGSPSKGIGEITTASFTLAMGVIWLVKQINNCSFSLWNKREKGETKDAVRVRFNKTTERNQNPRIIKEIKEIPYEGYVYDLEVEGEHRFPAGVGPIIVHNSFYGGWYLNALLNAHDLKLNQDIFVTRNNPVEPTPPDTLAQLYSAADVYALATGGEGFGMTELEAMACGLPQVNSDLENIKWLCGDASLYANTLLEDVMSTGEIMKIPDPDDFASKLKWLHDNPDKRQEMSQKALERAKQFSWEKSAQKFLDLLEKYENGELKGQSSWRYRRYQR